MSKCLTPKCECHGVPTRWAKDPRMKKGGRWRCRIEERTTDGEFKEMIRKRRFTRKKALRESEARLSILKNNREVTT